MTDTNTDHWDPTRSAALAQLSGFVPDAGKHYADKRNYDLGESGHQSVSRLSPWLRHRLITEQEVVSAVRAVHSDKAAEKYIQEVFWRSYWKGWLEMRPQVWHRYQQDLQVLYADEKVFSEVDAVLREGAGIDCFDHWLAELRKTGYLHNHARMWFASIWIFTLKLPWQLGADFFLQHLLDGDPASNTLSWRWVAGLQTKGKAYAASAENIAKFTNGRFNPVGQLNENIEPLTESEDFEKFELPASPESKMDGRIGLILHEEDLQPYIAGHHSGLASVVALQTSALLSPGGVSESVADFTKRCITSAANDLDADLSACFTCEVTDDVPSVVDQIIQWAQHGSFDAVIWRYAPTGPAATVLQQVCEGLTKHGTACGSIKSQWDATIWPHAGKGFFALKKKIPDLLTNL